MTQEFQIVSPAGVTLEYVAGLYFYRQKIDETTAFSGGQAVTSSYGYTAFDNTVEVDNIALFGQATYRFNERWAAFAGARLLREDIKAKGRRGGDFFAFPGQFPEASADNSDTDWIGTAGVQFFPGSDTMVYASVSAGYKGSAIDTTIGSSFYTGNTALAVLDPETVTSYEFGTKAALFGDRLQLSATAFYS